MNITDEQKLDQYLERWLQRRLQRRLYPWFVGTVTQVIGNAPPYLVKVVKNGEQTSDGMTYAVPSGRYVPQVGDVVDITWRDDNVGYVAVPLSGKGQQAAAGSIHAEVYQQAAESIANGFAFIHLTYDTVEAGAAYWDAPNSQFVCPVPGRYLVIAQVLLNVSPGGNVAASVFKNGSEERRLQDGTRTDGNPSAAGAAIVRAQAGDKLAIYAAQSTSSNPAALFVSKLYCYAQFEYRGPL